MSLHIYPNHNICVYIYMYVYIYICHYIYIYIHYTCTVYIYIYIYPHENPVIFGVISTYDLPCLVKPAIFLLQAVLCTWSLSTSCGFVVWMELCSILLCLILVRCILKESQ